MRLSLSLALSALLLPLTPVSAQTAAAPDAKAKPAAAKPAPKQATSREQLKNQAKGLALASEVTEQISEGQMQAAARVMTGDIDCEFNQKVSVEPITAKPGHFQVAFNNVSYVMTPQETTTGRSPVSVANRSRSSSGDRSRPSGEVLAPAGALRAVGMCPGIGSTGSTSPR